MSNSIVSELQTLNIDLQQGTVVNAVDLSVDDPVVDTPNLFIKYGTDAIKNRVLFWLGLQKGDIIRNPSVGGVLLPLLGNIMLPERAPQIENSLKDAFNILFATQMQIIFVKAEPFVESKHWKITMIVKDIIRDEIFTLAVGASL